MGVPGIKDQQEIIIKNNNKRKKFVRESYKNEMVLFWSAVVYNMIIRSSRPLFIFLVGSSSSSRTMH